MLDLITIADRSVELVSNGSFRDIRLFVAAYEERSFTAAARRENATQSGVSQHVRKLEDSLGVSLFVRSKGRVVATPAGDSYYRHCIELLNAHAKATADVRRHGAGLQGDIVIGLMPTMTRCALAPVLARFIDNHPNVVVRVVEGYSAALTEQVLAGQLEFAVVPAFSGVAGLKSRLFLRTPELLVSSRKLAARPPGTGPALRPRPAQAGGAEPGQHAPPPDRDLPLLQRRAPRAAARARRHAGHARLRRPHRLGRDPARADDGDRDRAPASSA